MAITEQRKVKKYRRIFVDRACIFYPKTYLRDKQPQSLIRGQSASRQDSIYLSTEMNYAQGEK
jgi:hypothetical protein